MEFESLNALSNYQIVSLADMGKTRLMNRTDTKFIFNVKHLDNILSKANDEYNVLEIKNEKIPAYESQYFDTENFYLYTNHQNGKLNRYKIRQRKYVSSDLSFFEIKFKSNKGRTIKKRIQIKDLSKTLNTELENFLESNTPYSSKDFKASVANNFCRITLVHKVKSERVTIDQRLNYKYNGNSINLNSLAIAEVKREGFSKSSFINILKQNKIYPQGMSKYCIGTLLLNNNLKHNRFKEKLLKLKKITNDDTYNIILNRY